MTENQKRSDAGIVSEIAIALATAALVLAAVSWVIPGPQGMMGPQGPTGNQGPIGLPGTPGTNGANGSNASSPPFVWGQASITRCDNANSTVYFVIRYANFGNATAMNVIVEFTIYAFTSTFSYPAVMQGSIGIGDVPATTARSISELGSLHCGDQGTSVDVSFSWSQ